jgi:hypothetical protein
MPSGENFMSLRGLGLRLALVLVSVSIAACVGEIVVRALGETPWRYGPIGEPDDPLHEPDDSLGWRNKAGVYEWTRSRESIRMTFWPDGLRSTAPERIEQSDRIVVVGGSVTQGWAVSDESTWPWRLQVAFPEFEFLNFGTAGYGTYQSLLALERSLSSGQPDPRVVIYGLIHKHKPRNVAAPGWLRGMTRASDLDVVAIPYATLDSEGHLERHPPKVHPHWPLKRFSALVAFLESRYVDWSGRHRLAQASEVTRSLLIEMQRVSNAHGAEFLVAILIDQPNHAQGTYGKFLREHGIAVAQCVPPGINSKKLKVPVYGHPNAIANQFWATCIGDRLAKMTARGRDAH